MRHTVQAIAAALVCAALSAPSFGQLMPDRTYYGVGRPIPMKVAVPAEAKGTGGAPAKIEVVLLPPLGTDKPVALAEQPKRPVVEGSIDLAQLFPALWNNPPQAAIYAQLVVNDTKIGPAVVLQPMITPLYAELANYKPAVLNAFDRGDRRRLAALLDLQSRARASLGYDVAFTKRMETPVMSGLRAWTDRNVVIDTDQGEMEIRLRPDMAPNTSWNFIQLVEGGFYTDIPVHRVVRDTGEGHPFVVQFGDPTGLGQGGPGYLLPLENSYLPHDYGVLSMARALEPDTGGSQVFIGLSREAAKQLDGNHAAFAEVVRGGETLQKIMLTRTKEDAPETPVKPPMVRSAKTIPAKPYGEGPGRITAPDPLSGR